MKKNNSYKAMRNILLVFSFVLPSMFTSCHFLEVDEYFDDTMKFDSIFTKYTYLSQYMWGISDLFPDESIFSGKGSSFPGSTATDEGFTGFSSSSDWGIAYVLGNINADNISGYSLNVWPNMYKVIRKCNYILSRKNEANLTTIQDEEITGYTHMMRGYAYYYLIRNYGPCILVGDEIFPNNELPEVYNKGRATYDECVDYCCEELERAAKFLPIEVPSNLFGRPSRGAAFALIARLRLTQASPLFNGGDAARTTYGTWKRSSDGVNYISQIYDERKWAVAAAACQRVINMGKYELHTVRKDNTKPTRELPKNVPSEVFPNGAGGIDCYRSYSEMFNGETIGSKNSEMIWGRTSSDLNNNLNKCSFPTNDVMGGWNGLCLTQKLVDAYYMVDGMDINNASEEYPYLVAKGAITDDNFSKSAETFSGYKLGVGVYGMYLNRENRFYATVGFSGRYWSVESNTQSQYGPFYVWYDERNSYGQDLYAGKFASLTNILDYPTTGYVVTKYINPIDAFVGKGADLTLKYYPIIRYAEILLGYVEAVNHLTTSYTIELASISGGNHAVENYTVSRDPIKIKEYFNPIRYRVGLPGLADSDINGGEKVLDDIIKREYMIEFAWEGRRYFDVRRWGIYEETEKAGIYGMHLGEDKYGYYQTPVPVNQVNNRSRVIDRKMILLPIPKSEVRRVEALDQNPGWEE